jgi:hypothetical protein
LRERFDPPAQRGHFGLDDIHTDAPASHLSKFGRGRETWLEDEIEERCRVGRLTVRQQPHGFGALANTRGIQSFAVIQHGKDDFIALLSQRHADFADFRFAGGEALLTGFDAVGHRIAQHVFDGPEHLVEHRTVNFNLATNDIQVGAFANLLGRLADDAVKAFRLTGEGNHPNAHQRLLQTAVKARLGKNGRIGVVEVLQQILLYRRHVIDRLGHEAGEFLEARKTVEFQRVELGLAFGGVSDVSLNLAFGLNFNFTQLAAQANDVFSEVEQRAFQAAHFAFNPGSCNRQLTRLVNQTVNQVGTDPYRCLLTPASASGSAFAAMPAEACALAGIASATAAPSVSVSDCGP